MSRSLGPFSLFALALPFIATACGRETDTDNTLDEATATNGTAGDNPSGANGANGTNGTNGGAGTNGSNGSGGDADPSTGSGACTPPGQQCMCASGQMGFQACTNGMLGECTCSIDLTDAGLPPPSECPAGSMCQGTMGIIMGVDGFCAPGAGGGGPGMNGGGFPGPGLPPMCASQDDCDKAGLPDAACQALTLPFIGAQRLCVQTCTP